MADVTIVSHVDEVKDALKTQLGRGLWAIGATAEGYAKEQLYDGHGLDTGRLRNSITHAEDEDAVYIGTNVEYGKYVELGTSKMAAIPFLKPAATEHTEEYKKLLEDALK